MSINFEELDYRQTHLGELILRRRRVPALGDTEVYEVKLGDAFLMSSLFTTGEIALAELGLAELATAPLDVVVGGLGLGYTAGAALDHPTVRSVLVIEALAEVIDWHQRGLVPLGAKLTADQRCRLINGDFFALANSPGQNLSTPERRLRPVV
jgi:spermidine synthase